MTPHATTTTPALDNPALDNPVFLDAPDDTVLKCPTTTCEHATGDAALFDGFAARLRRARESLIPQRIGPHRVLEQIAIGGCGTVFRAVDGDSREVAVKLLRLDAAAKPDGAIRFRREARVMASVCSAHVASVYGIGEHEGLPYLVMEYVEGESLQQRLRRCGPLPAAAAVGFARQAANGLAAAHRKGLIHRDIKPSNVLITRASEQVKIVDFGLARAVDDCDVTREDQLPGTANFMSPEQANGLPLDARTDLFSLGALLYTMLAGAPPFQADSSLAVMRRVCEHTPTPLRIVADTPAPLCRVVERLLSKRPADRYASAPDVARALAHLQHSLSRR